MKRITAWLLLCAMIPGLFAGCARKEEEAYVPTGGALVMEGEDPNDFIVVEEKVQNLTLAYYPERSMNPLIGVNISNRLVMNLIYQGLFAVDSKNNPTPILCSEWQVSADNRTYVFYLEENATFSDGTPVTPRDVLATYEAAKAGGYYKGRFTHIFSFDLKSDGGIVVYLDTPMSNLPVLLDIPILKAGEMEAEHPLGTGPYIFEESLSGMHLYRNPDWWCGIKIAAYADSIKLVEVTSQEQIRDEFQFGKVGLAVADPMVDSYAEYRCDYELWNMESGVFLYLGVNVTFSDYFKEDTVLRKALTYAIDRQGIVDSIYHGLAYPATLAASPGSSYYNKNMAAQYHYDPMKFLDKIKGWKPLKDEDGKEKKLILLVNSDDSARLRAARYIAETLTELGVPCGTLEYGNSSNPSFEVVLRANNWDLLLGETKLPPNNDLSEFYRNWGLLNYGGITNNTLLSQNLLALENEGNYYNLLKDMADTASIIPVLFGYYTVYAERGLFDNLTPSRDNVFYYSLGKTMEGTQRETVYN